MGFSLKEGRGGWNKAGVLLVTIYQVTCVRFCFWYFDDAISRTNLHHCLLKCYCFCYRYEKRNMTMVTIPVLCSVCNIDFDVKTSNNPLWTAFAGFQSPELLCARVWSTHYPLSINALLRTKIGTSAMLEFGGENWCSARQSVSELSVIYLAVDFGSDRSKSPTSKRCR